MTTKIVVRVIGDQNELIGWAETMAHARGDGQLWLTEGLNIPIEVEGRIAQITAHWVDVNVLVQLAVPAQALQIILKVGHTVQVMGPDMPIITVGKSAGGLHPVIVKRSVSLNVPSGRLGGVTAAHGILVQ